MPIMKIENSSEFPGFTDKVKTNPDSQVFVLVYMDGCGPCNATRPEWEKMSQAMNQQYPNNPDLLIATINQQALPQGPHIIGEIQGFPTMKRITDGGNIVESFEDSNISNKNRTTDAFITWIESAITPAVSTTANPSSPKKLGKRIRKQSNKKKLKGGKSRKSKRSKRSKKSKRK
jgi:hypothetical protein